MIYLIVFYLLNGDPYRCMVQVEPQATTPEEIAKKIKEIRFSDAAEFDLNKKDEITSPISTAFSVFKGEKYQMNAAGEIRPL